MRAIGRYVLEAELGRGGFGRVYRAWDPTVARYVAIKTLARDSDPETLTRFRNEAAAAGRLSHRNIVTVYDFGESADGEPYIVMELLDGRDLQRLLAAPGEYPLFDKMRILAEVAEALAHAHRNGVVHRDVKPANIMVMPAGAVKIMDFGIALLTQSATRLTQTGMVPGTLRYLAPEQFQGAPSDAVSDIFSYGVTYYEFLTGEHPFDAPTQPALLYRILSAEPEPISRRLPGCPPLLEQVVLRAMHKDRRQRYQSLDDLQLDLMPLYRELAQGRAAELARAASRSIESGDTEQARALLRDSLALDGANAQAQALRLRMQPAPASGSHALAAVTQPSVAAVTQVPRVPPRRWPWRPVAVVAAAAVIACAVVVVSDRRPEPHPQPVAPTANPSAPPAVRVRPEPEAQPRPVTPTVETTRASQPQPQPRSVPAREPAVPAKPAAVEPPAARPRTDPLPAAPSIAAAPPPQLPPLSAPAAVPHSAPPAEAEAVARAAEERRRAEQILEQARASEAAAAAARQERNAIYAALARYADAFASKDAAALAAAYPGIPDASLNDLKRAFKDRDLRITLSLQPLADPEVHGAAATIACTMATITVQKGRPSNSPARRVTVTLARQANGWVIQNIGG